MCDLTPESARHPPMPGDEDFTPLWHPAVSEAVIMSKWQKEKAERNRQALARLTRGLPAIFPRAVSARALNRPFIPPTPWLAIDSYWRAHPIRADRLARALAARSGAPVGWTAWGRPRERITTDLPNATGSLPRTRICAWSRFLLRVRAACLSVWLAC
jgi:hypothetical protein